MEPAPCQQRPVDRRMHKLPDTIIEALRRGPSVGSAFLAVGKHASAPLVQTLLSLAESAHPFDNAAAAAGLAALDANSSGYTSIARALLAGAPAVVAEGTAAVLATRADLSSSCCVALVESWISRPELRDEVRFALASQVNAPAGAPLLVREAADNGLTPDRLHFYFELQPPRESIVQLISEARGWSERLWLGLYERLFKRGLQGDVRILRCLAASVPRRTPALHSAALLFETQAISQDLADDLIDLVASSQSQLLAEFLVSIASDISVPTRVLKSLAEHPELLDPRAEMARRRLLKVRGESTSGTAEE